MTDEFPGDTWLAHAYCRCMLDPIPDDEGGVSVALTKPLESAWPTRTRITLVCSAPGCEVYYRYVGGVPRLKHEPADVEHDTVECRDHAHQWGWSTVGEGEQQRDYCPRHDARDDVDED